MADTRETNKQQADNARNIRQREGLQNAYAALLGQQSVQTFSAFTVEEAMDALIESIEGADSEIHPNQLKRVQRVKDNVLKAVAEIRNVPPEDFVQPSETDDVNTAP